MLINTGASVGVISTGTRASTKSPPGRPWRACRPGEQQAVSHRVPAREAADRLVSLQMANLLVAAPSPPTFGALSLRDLKARLKIKYSAASQTTQHGRRRRRRRDTDSETSQVI